MNTKQGITGGIDRALDTFVAAIINAVIVYDQSGDHRHDGSPVPGDCIRCNTVGALPPYAIRRIEQAALDRQLRPDMIDILRQARDFGRVDIDDDERELASWLVAVGLLHKMGPGPSRGSVRHELTSRGEQTIARVSP